MGAAMARSGQGTDGEVDSRSKIESPPSRPDLVESRAQHLPCSVHRLAQVSIRLEAVLVDERLVRAAESSGDLRIATRENHRGSESERPRERQRVSDRVAERQTLADVDGRSVHVAAAKGNRRKARETRGHPVGITERAMSFERFHDQCFGLLIFARVDEIIGEIPLDNRHTPNISAGFGERESLAIDPEGAFWVGVGRAREMSKRKDEPAGLADLA